MGIFNSFFGQSNQKPEQININWNLLTDINQLDDIVSLSNDKPVVIFKHSTRCSISRMALKQFEKEFNNQDEVSPYFLDLIIHREISNEIASRFAVTHQSPQLLLIKKGVSIYNVSHDDIDASQLNELLIKNRT